MGSEDVPGGYPAELHAMFLHLMELFDLSVQIPPSDKNQAPSHILIPSRLSYDKPHDMPVVDEDVPTIELHYRFKDKFIPPDLMGRLIARTYRFSISKHWQESVALKLKRHQTLMTFDRDDSSLRLVAWGPQPKNFFELLRNTIETILGTFQGLKVQRTMHCYCHHITHEEPCQEMYPWKKLQNHRVKRRFQIECPDSLENVDILTILTGHPLDDKSMLKQLADELHALETGQNQILGGQSQILAGQQLQAERLQQQTELMIRGFTRQWNLLMKQIQVECPNTFILMPNSNLTGFENLSGFMSNLNPKNWFSHTYNLHLLCQHPACPHQIDGDAGYEIRQPKAWWQKVSPWLQHGITFLRYVTPLAGVVNFSAENMENLTSSLELMEQICEYLPPTDEHDMPHANRHAQELDSAALRTFHALLEQIDPQRRWANLHKTVTPDENILWLCPEHHAEFERGLIKLN